VDTQALDTSVVPFEFTGKAGEYFGIWIVNVSLTLLTLSIYSAWAKVGGVPDVEIHYSCSSQAHVLTR
jgi:uncharacterized membrane protein YjgN (DUF898 family)